MRVRSSLLVLGALSLVLAGTANAALSQRSSGLACTATGGATLGSSTDSRRLPVNNLGSSGNDGVDISLSRLDGHTMTCATTWSALDAGTECRWSWVLTNPATGGTIAAKGGLKRTTEMIEWRESADALSSSSSMTCLVYLHDALVSSLSCPTSSMFELHDLVPGSVSRIPEVTFELDHASQRCLSSVSLQSSALFVFGGVSLECDRVVCVSPVEGDPAMDHCELRCASPASSSVHALDFSSQSFVRFGASIALADLDADGLLDVVHVQSNPLYSDKGGMLGTNPLYDRVFGHGGGAGGGLALAEYDKSSPKLGLAFSRTSPFTLDPRIDNGASLECDVLGSGGCSPTGVVSSLKVSVQDLHLRVSSSFAGMCADQESVVVLSRGQVVSRAAVALDNASVTVDAPPGSTPLMAMTSAGPRRPGYDVKTIKTVAPQNLGTPAGTSTSTPHGPERQFHSLAFADQRVFCVDGTCTTGDEIVFTGECTSGACNVITIVGNNFSLQRCSSGSCSSGSSSMQIQDVGASGIDQVVADIPPTAALSTTHTVVDVPVVFDRVDATPVRGYSVTLSLSPGLQLAGPVVENDYLSSHGQTQMYVTTNSDGSLTVDCALLGPGCGPTTSGRLFTLPVSLDASAPPACTSGACTGFVDITAVDVADCNAGPVAGSPGGKSYLLIDSSPPAAPTLTATQVKSGNDASGTTRINLQLGSLAVEDNIEIYRAPFGNYPEYGTGATPGSVPPMPSYPPAAIKWSRVNATRTPNSTGGEQCDDKIVQRDSYYYLCYSVDRAGNVSPPSSMTGGTLNYFLGDVAGGGAVCAGDNQVTTADISALGAHYGASLATGSSLECLDVGPTSNGTVDGRPLADHRLQFKDLILYAINYATVSAPAMTSRPVAAAENTVRLRMSPLPGVGQTFDVAVEMAGAGDAQGVSTQLSFDPAIVEPVAATQGELLSRQGRQGVVFSAQPGNVDAALLGVGPGLAGEGDLARVTFRVKAQGDPAIGIAGAEARDAQNRQLALSGAGAPGTTPGRTALRMAFPNPFDQSTTVVFSLYQAGPASVRVFDVAGRTVRTLVSGVQPAGERVLAWDGRDDNGARLGAGVYMLRLESGGHSETRAVRLVK